MRNSAFLALAAGTIAGVNAMAQGPVYSVNIVGFQKVGVTNEFTQVGSPFVKPTANLNSVIGVQGDAGPSAETADTVYIWNGVSYITAFLSDASNAGFGNQWVELDDNTGDLVASNTPVPPGTGFWWQNRGATNTVTIVGDVELAATKNVTINPGFNMISYPYSTSVSLNTPNLNLDNTTGVLGNSSGSADIMYVWNGASYLTISFIQGSGVPELDNKWCIFDDNTGDLAASNYTIQPGQSIWYFRSGANPLSWSTSKPY